MTTTTHACNSNTAETSSFYTRVELVSGLIVIITSDTRYCVVYRHDPSHTVEASEHVDSLEELKGSFTDLFVKLVDSNPEFGKSFGKMYLDLESWISDGDRYGKYRPSR